jgi:hypothetical protein
MLGSQWEAQLLSPEILQMAGFDPTQPFAGDPTTLAMASPLRGMNPRLKQWGNGVLQSAMLQKNMCILQDQPEPDSLVGMARQASQLFPMPNPKDPAYPAKLYQRDQALHQWIREQFHLSVIAHEMGHSMGLRHNFTGSWDALNYHTEYWQLRTRNGQEHYCGYPGKLDATTPHTNGADCAGPRWVDPLTEQETNDLIWKWASSTVMDYPGDQTQDMNDIGLYDKAAMRFGYTSLVDVENKMKFATGSDGSSAGSGYDFVGGIQLLDGFGGIFGNSYGNTYQSQPGAQGNHYSTYADKYALLGDCSQARPGWNGDPKDPLAKQCTGSNLDYVARRDMLTVPKLSQSLLSSQPSAVANFAVTGTTCGASGCKPDNKSRVRHPYLMGSDEFADFGNVPVFRFDAGADAYEQMQFLVSTYENRYIFNNFRRNRVTFNTNAVVGALQSRYWDKIKYIAKSLALGIELNYTIYPQGSAPADPTQDPGFLMPMALGTADGFAMFIRSMTRPAPGTYYSAAQTGTVTPPNQWATVNQVFTNQTALFNVSLGNGQGRYLHNDYDYTQGYWWADYQTQVGGFYEKFLAPSYLTEAYNDFISNSPDDYIDGRYKNLSFVSLYPQQVRRIFANLVSTQSATLSLDAYSAAQIFQLAPYVTMSGTGSGSTPPAIDVQYLPWHMYDTTEPGTTSLNYPNNAVLLDPLVGWEEQFPALINLFWYGPSALNMDLIDQMRIFSPGDAASLSIPESQQVRYSDPATGIEYVAKNYGTETVNANLGFEVAKTIGSSMIQHANALAKIAYKVTATDSTTGELTYATDAQGNAVMNGGQSALDAAAMLKNYASNLDTVRQLTLFFGYGPLGH